MPTDIIYAPFGGTTAQHSGLIYVVYVVYVVYVPVSRFFSGSPKALKEVLGRAEVQVASMSAERSVRANLLPNAIEPAKVLLFFDMTKFF